MCLRMGVCGYCLNHLHDTVADPQTNWPRL